MSRIQLSFSSLYVCFLFLPAFAIPLLSNDLRGRIKFEDRTSRAGIDFQHLSGGPLKDYIVESKGGGVAVLDYDGDGWLDIYLVSGTTFELLEKPGSEENAVPRNALYRNNRDGTFSNVSGESGTDHPGWGMGASVADFDGDGDEDLYLSNYGPDVLYRNEGNGTFVDVTEQAGISVPGWSTGSAWGDYDRDGDLDLYVARYIDFDRSQVPPRGSTRYCQYRGLEVQCGPRGLDALPDRLFQNQGDGTFLDVSAGALGSGQPRYYGFTPIWADFDRDGLLDLFVANDATPNLFYLNSGDGTFREQGAVGGSGYSNDGREQSGMGADIADINHDGLIDLFVANFSDDYNTVYLNTGEAFFEDVTGDAELMSVSWQMVGFAVKFLDFDLDGWKDLFVVNGHVYPEIDSWEMDTGYRQHPQLLRNQADGTFKDITLEVGGGLLVEKVGRGAAFGDLDNDGDIDAIVNNLDDTPTLLICQNSTGHNWLGFELRGSQRNHFGIGAVVKIKSGEHEEVSQAHRSGGFLSSNDPRVHFGLGSLTKVDSVEILWPSGATQSYQDLPINTYVTIREGSSEIAEIE